MIVIVTGSRTWGSKSHIHEWLDHLAPDIVVQGGAPGADAFAHEWAKLRGRVSATHFAKWEEIGNSAGPLRNIEMLEKWSTAEYVIGFPTKYSKGTIHMMKAAEKRGFEVINGTLFDPTGENAWDGIL